MDLQLISHKSHRSLRMQKFKNCRRAGIGTDNIDKLAATKNGVIVMNTPFGNAVTLLTYSFMMSLVG